MAKREPDLIDEIINDVRRLINEIDRLIHPEKRRKRAVARVPVRPHPQQRDGQREEDPYA
jgi:hypothetical protein